MKLLDKITPLEQDFSKWYIDVVKQGDLIDYGPVKGTLIFKPNAYGIWEQIQFNLNRIFKEKCIKNVYLPLFIPEKLFNKEKEHIKGFNPELATVTMAGDKKLDEKIFIRPTSEVLFANLFKNSVESYNDLPLIYNQWVNVVRWEKTTNPFLRNREFLWQEGHTCHSDPLEARQFTKNMIMIYNKFLRNYLAIPTIVGKKTSHEKFAGACSTYTIEAMMKDGKALQAGTSHYLAQNFSKQFDIKFKNYKNVNDYVYQTSWGISTRLIGAIIMTHGDNRGIIIPPKVAPIQISIIELFANKNPKIHELALQIKNDLSKKYRVFLDESDKSPGYKAANSEIQGIPLRIEIGPKDIDNNTVTFVRRDTQEKEIVSCNELKKNVKYTLDEIHINLLQLAEQRLEENTIVVTDYETFKEGIKNRKFVIAPFCCSGKTEDKIKEETGATSRCIPKKINKPVKAAKCIYPTCKSTTNRYVVFAKAY
ncbi:Prolyl-tRNA synthetase [Mycoplasmopsis meleagridis]|uniref:Proline--tRNA ligase n=1 Tax=Mycoplasmopsis meleagridis ATCC 25294 TaxID=1264554 RepID=A0A0F5H0S1_9BACT|nr:proline--tRNA ligase [Mycoplasmopsis meleagridis]KKB26725.1 Prolyl-tRNA synthetase [Mycoplasmopsis meleagridis ATCC 25294]OAD18159.1 Prolyl-tRNA synthetase [Mycoplasmopsis meleagridis]VEU77258.1 Proline--tRNA ligase [Mycoplasmopsis meleagridis]